MAQNHKVASTLQRRNPQFDLLRLSFSICVLLAHAPEITDGNSHRELMFRLTGGVFSTGTFAVYGFFLLSGYLIVQSWQGDPDLKTFVQKRLLRLVPGYAVAVTLSILVVGVLAPAGPHFFGWPGRHSVLSVLILGSPMTSAVFPGQAFPLVNGSLWTIPYELHCYALVAVAGLLGIFRRTYLWAALTILLLAIISSQALFAPFDYHHLKSVLGEPDPNYRFGAAFAMGGCYRLFRTEVVYHPLGVFLAFAGLAMARFWAHPHFVPIFLVLGSYIILFLANYRFAFLNGLHRMPDISYGVYLYGWPVEALWVFYRHGSPWVTFVVTTVLCSGLGWLSWHFVERPALTLKPRATRALPES